MASTPVSPFSSSGPQVHSLQRVGQLLPARPRAGSPGDLLRLEGESRQRPPRSGQALSSCSACFICGRRASPPPLGRARVAVPQLARSPGGKPSALHMPGAGSLPFDTPAADGRHLLRSAGRVLPSGISVYLSPRLAREAQDAAGLLAPGHLESGSSSLHGTTISSGDATLLRRRLHSGGAPLLRIIARLHRSTRTTRPTSWLS
ncbi:hypothetical protein NDU88_007528 [Pleurodeles waltl]|uniref:Uncharacterized protein n=1 Tax=Pleurodeles waltl TaxID=8319 RepID=A0AAV7NWW6_PLEWA|nr:hypothetical protein NDU88_007528 [Pleurodeles waltl]